MSNAVHGLVVSVSLSSNAFFTQPIVSPAFHLHQVTNYGPDYLPLVFPDGAVLVGDIYQSGLDFWQLQTTTDLQPGNTNSSANGGVGMHLIGQGTAGAQMGDTFFAVSHISEADAAAAIGNLQAAANNDFPNSYWEWGIGGDDNFYLKGGAIFQGLTIDAVTSIVNIEVGLVSPTFTPTSPPLLATGAGRTVDQVITALQTIGLVRQS